MKTLNAKNQKTFEALQSKAAGKSGARFPSIKRIAELLNELDIEFDVFGHSVTKPRGGETAAFTTSGGRKETHGHRMRIPAGNIRIDNTCSWFSRNTENFAIQILKVIQ